MTDANSIDTTDVRGSCTWCEGSLRPSHFVHAVGGKAHALCSEDCLRAKLRDVAAGRARVRRRNLKWLVVTTSLVAACITPHDGPRSLRRVAMMPKAPVQSPDAPLPGAFGPEWPPSEASLLADLGRDAWLHPLAGPFRRMPLRDSRVFGAERPGDRPIECRKGHCGVDLGGEIWGEQVRAAHDGVVDRVQRALNPDHGGRYVRLAHRDGTIITQYFHLSEIPRRLVEGAAVKAGEVVGFVGLTGVKRSEPHLHFTIEVQDPSGHEARYLDPEPLVALWPLRVSSKSDDRLHVSTAPPGLARGFLRRRHRHHAAAEAD